MKHLSLIKSLDHETQLENGRYNLDIRGKKSFGTLYELEREDLETLLVFLGDKINEIKGGMHEENE